MIQNALAALNTAEFSKIKSSLEGHNVHAPGFSHIFFFDRRWYLFKIKKQNKNKDLKYISEDSHSSG